MKKKIVISAVFVWMFTFANAQESFQWRGKERDGNYKESGLLKTWPENGPQLLWEVFDVGKGYSSPVIVGNNVFVTGLNEDGNRELFSAYTLDGKKVYAKEYAAPWDGAYPETRTTPTVINGNAYTVSGSGEIACINIADGNIIWLVDGGKQFARKPGRWGTSESPLVFDNKVVYTPSGEKTTMVALDAATGKTLWESPALGDIGAYVSPMLITYNGKKQIIGITGKNVIGVNPENGAIEWKFDDWDLPPNARRSEGKTAPNTPLYKDGCIFVSQGYDIGSFMLKLNDELKGVSLLWRNDDLDTHIGGYVLVNNTIYGSNWINNGQGNWVAVDWKTGETKYNQVWKEGKSKGAIITADNMLYCYDERRGTVGLVRPNPEKFDVVSEFRITKGEGPHWAHPVINNGVLYIRHGSVLQAYKITN